MSLYTHPTYTHRKKIDVQVVKDFSKGGSDKSVYGVFTRDYRINALEARILVTVPACLEILLFSPAHREWASRLRYVIFDEVHCMREGGIREGGAAESTGTIWEHCLLLIRYYTHAMLFCALHTHTHPHAPLCLIASERFLRPCIQL